MPLKAVAAVGLLLFSSVAWAADCKIATVGSPFSTCWDIANAAGINVDTLQTYNPNLNCNILTPGQKLCVSTGTFPVPKPNPDGTCATHTVVAGDTCLAIANVYGITTANIETWSKPIWRFQGCSLLQIGAKVCISTGLPPPIPVNPSAQCGPETPGNKTCPLNVCCSAWGFCGQTSEFCEAAGGFPCNSNCGTPTLARCSGSQQMRKIGYFAGWAARRPENCGRVTPADLDLTGYTGVIFAFATIDNHYNVTLDSRDASVLEDLVALKDRWRPLQVTIAVGGWAFSMDDPTKTVFTQMISTSASRTTFINSVKDFMSTYRLDGVDIDLEYPAASERAAPAEDTPNLTALMRELRAALGSQVVSIATPAAYWFLRGFEIDKIASSATYVNVMTYDYHGPWDLKLQGEDGTAKAHTSVEDIMDTIRLYTRAEVPFSKLNLGLAWYGRTYAVGNCKGTGCVMTGGGKPGMCTGESGIKSQEEINKEVADNKITRNYDTTTRTYWYNYNGDFITYDDTDSWAHKTQVAKDHCFNGTFVWSLDQGNTSTSALASSLSLPVKMG
ncbi:glycoside hydrolase [Coprinellus micaceus]|uniref:Glycoside hydrolase n=1 Tax=Coprinellus micaceus TaxID=71717 RepID=A0A4Y7SII8_COPMI|nr:glycoside hydrolase [Coprinellus micaceus]